MKSAWYIMIYIHGPNATGIRGDLAIIKANDQPLQGFPNPDIAKTHLKNKISERAKEFNGSRDYYAIMELFSKN